MELMSTLVKLVVLAAYVSKIHLDAHIDLMIDMT